MNINQLLKKGAAGLLSVGLLVSVAACGESTDKSDSSVAPDVSSTVSTVGAGDLTMGDDIVATGKMTYSNAEDTSEVKPLSLEIEGNYVQLTNAAMEAVASGSGSALTSLDMPDGSLMIVNTISGDFGGFTLQFIHIDTATGKLIDTATCNLFHAFNSATVVQWQDIRGKEGYPEGTDLLIQTSTGAYLFDLDDLSKDPIAYKYDGLDTGNLPITTSDDGQTYDATYFNRVYDVLNQKIYYSTDEGLYSMNADGSDVLKIADQPEKKDWFATWPAGNKRTRPTSEEQNAYFGCLRLFDGGKKMAAQLMNFDIENSDTVGVAIIDLETNTVESYGYFAADSPLSSYENWTNMSSFTINDTIAYVDDTTLGILVSGPDSTSPFNQVRWDILMDVTDGTVKRANPSPTGLTTNYQVEAVNDAYKGATGKCTFYDMGVDNYVTEGLYITQDGTTIPHTVSANYGLFKVSLNPTRDENGVTSEVNASERAFYLVPVVRDAE